MPRQAYAYLNRFKGLDHLYNHYNVMHTFSFEDTVDAVAEDFQSVGYVASFLKNEVENAVFC